MKKSFAFFSLLFLVSALFAGKGLIVTQNYTTATAGQHITVTWYVTDSRCKMKMLYSDKDVNTTTFFIPELSSGKLLSYSDAPVPANSAKAYFALPVQNIKSRIGFTLSVEKTGEVKTVAGVKCEKVIAKTAENITEMWVTAEGGTACAKFAPYFKSSYEFAALAQGNIAGFPVESVTKDASGNVISTYSAVSVSATDISDTEFAVPADYKSAEELAKSKK
jgi:hypothetical protein